MAYSFDGRVRYSEIGENGCLTLPGILNYFQDCSTFHSEDVGLGMEPLRRRGRAWVLSSWQVVVNRYPRLGEKIRTVTFPYDFKGFMGKRNFYMETEDGERLAWANTFWTYLSLETGLPVKLTEEDTDGYELEEKLDMDYAPRKVALPENPVKQEPFRIQKHHLDTNHHVNNCQYVRMAQDYLPEDFGIRQMRAEYKMQARLGDLIFPEVSAENGKVTIALNNEEKQPYAVVEYVQK